MGKHDVLAENPDQTCTRLVARQVPDDYGDAVMTSQPCGALVPPGQMFCHRCEAEVRARRAAEVESDAA